MSLTEFRSGFALCRAHSCARLDLPRDFSSILQEHEAGAKCADLCRKHGMSEGTSYARKAKYSGMTVSEAKRPKALEDENAKLKKLLAEQMLDMAAMKELLSIKW